MLKSATRTTFFTAAKVFWLLASLLIAFPSLGGAPAYHVYFASESENGYADTKPETKFDCTQKIYAVLESRGLRKKKHKLEIYWINPRGKRQEYTKFDFFVNDDKRVVWAWLKLHRPAEAIMDRVFLQDRASGMEDFIGQWRVRFHVDGKLVKEGSFTVYC